MPITIREWAEVCSAHSRSNIPSGSTEWRLRQAFLRSAWASSVTTAKPRINQMPG